MEDKVFYVTKEKLKELKREHEELISSERVKTVGQEAPKVLESEDMNPEFVSYQEDIESLRSRIDELQNILDNHQVITRPSKEKRDLVSLGARVALDVNGKHDEFEIVGTLEANPAQGRISNESPVGMALIGHRVGDEVVIHSPKRAKYRIKGIKYQTI